MFLELSRYCMSLFLEIINSARGCTLFLLFSIHSYWNSFVNESINEQNKLIVLSSVDILPSNVVLDKKTFFLHKVQINFVCQ